MPVSGGRLPHMLRLDILYKMAMQLTGTYFYQAVCSLLCLCFFPLSEAEVFVLSFFTVFLSLSLPLSFFLSASTPAASWFRGSSPQAPLQS